MKNILLMVGLAVIFTLSACDAGVDSPRGFSLPKGDADAGRKLFLEYQCLACHSLKGFESEIEDIPSQLSQRVPLGGPTMRITTYAQLVTSIINPSHKISRGIKPYNQDEEGNSTMRNYNQEMTVQELIDIVAYLEPQYDVIPHPYTSYNNYDIHFK